MPVSLDLSTQPPIWKCCLRLLSSSAVTSVGDLATCSIPSTTLWLLLRMMNLLLCYSGRVGVLRSTGTSSWMPWYRRMNMVRVTDLTWLMMMGVTLLLLFIRVRRRRMVLSLTPAPRTMLISRLSKPSSIANSKVERQISGTKLSISVWDFLSRPQWEFTICTPWRR